MKEKIIKYINESPLSEELKRVLLEQLDVWHKEYNVSIYYDTVFFSDKETDKPMFRIEFYIYK